MFYLFVADTDSVVCICKKNNVLISCGSYLGNMSSELEKYGPGAHGKEWVCAGSKNYVLSVYGHDNQLLDYIMRIRGITLNHRNCQIISFDTMKAMVTERAPPIMTYTPHKITRTKTSQIISKPQHKIYRAVFENRWRVPDSYLTLPYGYKM